MTSLVGISSFDVISEAAFEPPRGASTTGTPVKGVPRLVAKSVERDNVAAGDGAGVFSSNNGGNMTAEYRS